MRVHLLRHPDRASPATSIAVEARRDTADVLSLHYRLGGDLAQITLPAPCNPARVDGLWRHTCFEAFVRAEGQGGYCELNLAPSRRWAAYRLEAYRSGMAEADMPPPVIAAAVSTDVFELQAELDLSGLPDLAGRPWRLGLSAVVEAVDGGLSYWALAHPPGDPDFHHEAGFALRL